MSAIVVLIVAVAGYLIYKGGSQASTTTTTSTTSSPSLLDEILGYSEEGAEAIGLTGLANSIGNIDPTGVLNGQDTDPSSGYIAATASGADGLGTNDQYNIAPGSQDQTGAGNIPTGGLTLSDGTGDGGLGG